MDIRSFGAGWRDPRKPGGKVEITLVVLPEFKGISGMYDEGTGCYRTVVGPDKGPDDRQLVFSAEEWRNLAGSPQQWTWSVDHDPVTGCSEKLTVRINATCRSQGLHLFEPMMPVFTHPRCINCHGVVNPLTGADHGGGKIDVPSGTDITTEGGNATCVQACHDEQVFNGVTPWRLAPKNTHFVGKDSLALCRQMKQMIDDNDLQFFGAHR